jgi:hypothetical protein
MTIGDLIRRCQLEPPTCECGCDEVECAGPVRDYGLTVGDARKRLAPLNHDEVHAHLDVDWNIVRGED